jgi:hypothetical protein
MIFMFFFFFPENIKPGRRWVEKLASIEFDLLEIYGGMISRVISFYFWLLLLLISPLTEGIKRELSLLRFGTIYLTLLLLHKNKISGINHCGGGDDD